MEIKILHISPSIGRKFTSDRLHNPLITTRLIDFLYLCAPANLFCTKWHVSSYFFYWMGTKRPIIGKTSFKLFRNRINSIVRNFIRHGFSIKLVDKFLFRSMDIWNLTERTRRRRSNFLLNGTCQCPLWFLHIPKPSNRTTTATQSVADTTVIKRTCSGQQKWQSFA